MRSIAAAAFLLVTLVGVGSCTRPQNVECVDAINCDLAGGGRCIAAPTDHHWCAYPDSTCPGGFRYSEYDVGDGLASQCVDDGGLSEYTLTVVVDGPGSVRSQPDGVACTTGTCTAKFPAGENVRLTATPATDAIFVGFTEGCSGSNPECSISMTADRTAKAAFALATCEPNRVTCTDSTLNQCDESGHSHTTACLLGCEPSGTRCYDLMPSNSNWMTACLDEAALETDHVVPDGATINTDTGAITIPGGGIVNVPSSEIEAPAGGVSIRCFRTDDITIGNVTVVGANAFAVAANGTVTIRGALSVSARSFEEPGPGAVLTCIAGDAAGASLRFSGAGGGGFGTKGGDGGSSTLNVQGAPRLAGGAGSGLAGNANLSPLRGGCMGGSVRLGERRCKNGGGAIQITSRGGIVIEASGRIAANGWGGGGDPQYPWSNGGGGSGGGILLDAPFVTLAADARLAANGGGGGGVVAGSPGTASADPALGAPAGSNNAGEFGSGGNGGVNMQDGNQGQNVTGDVVKHGGGGGGGVGRIRINTYQAFVPATGAIASPPASTGTIGRR